MVQHHKSRLSFLSSFSICRPKKPDSSFESPLPSITYVFSPLNSNTFDISIPGYPDPPPSRLDQPTSQGDIMPLCQECPTKSCKLHDSSFNEYSSSFRDLKGGRKGKERMYSSPVSSDSEGDACPIAPSRNESQKMKFKSKINISTSSASYETDCPFSSPTSFNSSYNEYPLKTTPNNSLQQRKKTMKQKNGGARKFELPSSTEWDDGDLTTPLRNCETTGRTSVSGMLTQCKVDVKVNQSFVVVKKSVNPFEDFKKSMLEMILERQLFEPLELEELLMSFLTLNSRSQHKVIIEAFAEILKEVNCRS